MKKLLFIGIVTIFAGTQSGWAQVTGALSGRVLDATLAPRFGSSDGLEE